MLKFKVYDSNVKPLHGILLYNLFKSIHHQNKPTFEHLNILQSFLKNL